MAAMGMLLSFIAIASQVEINVGCNHIMSIFEWCCVAQQLGTHDQSRTSPSTVLSKCTFPNQHYAQFGHAHGAGHLLIGKNPETASRANIRAIRIIKPPPIWFTILTRCLHWRKGGRLSCEQLQPTRYRSQYPI